MSSLLSFAPSIDWTLFTSTFALIFVAELPDKTALATIVMATAHRPFAVFLGAAAAFVVQSVVAILFGSVFGLLPEKLVHIASALLFIFFAFRMWRKGPDDDGSDVDTSAPPNAFWRSAAASFIAVFIAEWGDMTQIATATLQAKYHATATIFMSATLALWTVAALGAIVGHGTKHLVKQSTLQKVASVAMGAAGIYMLWRS